MATAALIPVSEYLSTMYRPDCDYIDGEVQERKLGENSHSGIQGILFSIFHANRRAWGVTAWPEHRLHVAAERYRVPDILVLRRSDPKTPVIEAAPLICIEVLSPDDTLRSLQGRINDYVGMGVEHIWLIDPETRDAWIALPDGSHQHIGAEFNVPGTPIRVVLAEVFAELEEMRSQA